MSAWTEWTGWTVWTGVVRGVALLVLVVGIPLLLAGLCALVRLAFNQEGRS